MSRFARPDPWHVLAGRTPARVALGRAGASLPTRQVLELALAHARARDAIHTPLDLDRVETGLRDVGLATLRVASAAATRDAYLRRPDQGRRLSQESRAALTQAPRQTARPDLALVVADGLSSAAVHEQAVPVLAALVPLLARRVVTCTPVVVASQGRVALGDEIGEVLNARAVAILLGERPGLSSPASLGIYLTFAPRIGRTDAERNCISNIRAGGVTAEQGAHKLDWLLREAFSRQLTGVALKDESDTAPLPGAGVGQLT
jgi:ethanolamine ammonia-lyase small subunit